MVAIPKTAAQTPGTQPNNTSYRGTAGLHVAQAARLNKHQQKQELLKCKRSVLYFVDTYIYIYDAVVGDWVPFKLWRAQAQTLRTILANLLVVILKARQIGMTWLALSFALWLMLFYPAATVLLFSRRDDEAIELLDERLKGMYYRLPSWMQARAVTTDSKHEFALSNGSRALAFPTNGGDSYTATLVIADEFDLVPDQDRLMRSVKPTIDNGGRLILLSRPDKSRPQTRFKRYYTGAKQGLNKWAHVFLPWYVHPRRDGVWYEAQRADVLSSTGSEDDLHEQYPATDAEALAPRTLDKRLAPKWLLQCYQEMTPVVTVGVDDDDEALPKGAPAIIGLRIYALPVDGHEYVIGADPAEGNPTSDDSAFKVLDRYSGEEVASLVGKFQPSTMAANIDAVGTYYHDAAVMVERNNHGHAVILWLEDNSDLTLLVGHDDKTGWNSNTRGKTLLYDTAADAFRHGETIVHGFRGYTQLQSIEGSTLRAPEGEHDDEADAYALALAAMVAPDGRANWETVVG